jgi:hypothetical protein
MKIRLCIVLYATLMSTLLVGQLKQELTKVAGSLQNLAQVIKAQPPKVTPVQPPPGGGGAAGIPFMLRISIWVMDEEGNKGGWFIKDGARLQEKTNADIASWLQQKIKDLSGKFTVAQGISAKDATSNAIMVSGLPSGLKAFFNEIFGLQTNNTQFTFYPSEPTTIPPIGKVFITRIYGMIINFDTNKAIINSTRFWETNLRARVAIKSEKLNKELEDLRNYLTKSDYEGVAPYFGPGSRKSLSDDYLIWLEDITYEKAIKLRELVESNPKVFITWQDMIRGKTKSGNDRIQGPLAYTIASKELEQFLAKEGTLLDMNITLVSGALKAMDVEAQKKYEQDLSIFDRNRKIAINNLEATLVLTLEPAEKLEW